MLNLVIDIGNTSAKVALFNNRDIINVTSIPALNQQAIDRFIGDQSVDRAILSSVNAEDSSLEEYLQSTFDFIRFSSSVEIPILNLYESKETLGLDRLAAVVGAAVTFRGSDCLVIDAGTCITYDFIGRDMIYYGGSISPGIDIRFKAMHSFTARLPLLNADKDFEGERGSDTRTAMVSGVQNGVRYEVEGFIRSYSSRYPDLKVVLCGGDTDFFATQLKNSIFAANIIAAPHLVLIGLNEVIHHHNND